MNPGWAVKGSDDHRSGLLDVRVPGLAATSHPSTAGGSRVILHGYLDLATAPALAGWLYALLNTGSPFIEVDLAQLSFLGLAGVHVFHEVDRRCRVEGGRLVLLGPDRTAQRLLALTARDGVLTEL